MTDERSDEIEEAGGKPIFRRSVETEMCLALLLKAAPGDVIPYEQFSDALNLDLETAKDHVRSARGIAEKEQGIVTSCVREVGVKLLKNEEIPDVATPAISHIRRVSRRTTRKLDAADYDKLSESAQYTLNVKRTILHMASSVTKPKTESKLLDAVKETKHSLSFGDAIKRLGVKVPRE